jgi:signal transduction histidine kinase
MRREGVTGVSVPGKVNILLVDDQPARLLSYETILKPLDQNLIAARSGPEALERLMLQDFAVILLDVSMPGMDGFEAAALIHQHPRFEKTPIIFVTGVHLSELDKLRGYELGAVDYVYVPVVPEILRSKVSVLVELHHQRLELQRLNRSLGEAHTRLQQSHTQLQAERTRDLEALNATLTRANDDLAAANQALHVEVAVREKAELALKEADRQKDAFLAVLAHELRNPLAPIRNAVEIMRRRSVEDKDLIWAREVIGRQLLQLTRLVDDLLDVSRITRGHITLSLEPVEVATVVERAIETAQPLIAEHGHELTVEIPDEALEVCCDLTRITQALANLLSNAAKYTDRGGRITLRVEREGASVAVRVSDTGIGMDEALVPKLFSLFSQADSAKSRSPGGLGIGLALARQLVELQGGTVAASSAGHNLGSEFVIRLPLLAGAERGQRAAPEEPLPPPQETIARGRILLADDNKDSLDSLACGRCSMASGPWRWPRSIGRASRCSTSACRTMTAARSPAGSAASPGASRRCSLQ